MSQPPTSKYPDYSEVTTLRLELNRLKDKADAFERILQTEILKVAKVAIYQASIDAGHAADADTIGCMGVELDDLKAENARLKEENNLLRMRAIDDPVIRKAMLQVIQERAYVGQYPNPVNLVPIKQAGDDKKGDAS